MSIWSCGTKAFARKTKNDMSNEDRAKIEKRMNDLAFEWESTKSGRFQNVKDAKWNNFETFEDLWRTYTHKELEPTWINFKDIRKFEAGLEYYNQKIATPRGFWAQKFFLPRAALQNVPELKKFETQLINETSFFRDYSNETNKQVNDFLDNFKEFAKSTGSKMTSIKSLDPTGQKQLRKFQNEYDNLMQQWLSTSDPAHQVKIGERLRANRAEIRKFYDTGSGEAFKIVNSVLQGADVESIPNLSNPQKAQLNKMVTNYQDIRRAGVTSLIRGLQKVKLMAKDKNLEWVDGTVDRINGLIKSIEFQHTIDERGVRIEYKHLQAERDFLALGFRPEVEGGKYVSHGKVKFSNHYMSQYTLGVLKTIKKLENAVFDNRLSLDEQIRQEVDSWESIVNVAKNRSPILNPVYDNDPYFFLKKYTSDVGIFNYKAHVKSTFKDAVDTITNEHLKPAKEAGREDLATTAEDMKKLITDVYKEIQHVDPNLDNTSHDLMRVMTSVTYFRLMGGNVRSAARNATQRLHEWVEFGFKASLVDSRKFYGESGQSSENSSKLDRQLKRFGLQWFDGKSRTSNAFDALKQKNAKVSEQSRGALEDSYMGDKELVIDRNGELQIRGQGRIATDIASRTSRIAQIFGGAHRIVEDWNRSKTFKVGFALAHQNLSVPGSTWIAKKILGREGIKRIRERKGEDYQVEYRDLQEKYGTDTQKTVDNWIENTAGQIAYNSVLDLHFEYAKWNKARAIKATSDTNMALNLAKVGFGQFAHYRFNMVNLMYKWAKEGGLSLKAGDITSEEFIRPFRFGMLQAMIWGGTIATKTNFSKLAPNDVIETGDAAYRWLTTDRDDPEQLKKLDKATYGQGGFYFLGPNMPYLMSLYELLTHSNMGIFKDERTQLIHTESIKQSMKRDENQELYEKLATINSQMARSWAYTSEVWQGGGSLKDMIYLELGLFPSKEQKEWSKWLRRVKPKKRKKKIVTSGMSPYQKQLALKALKGL